MLESLIFLDIMYVDVISPRRYPDSGKERSPFIIMSIISLDSDTFIMVSLLAL